jgi:hypothetical protein
MHKAVKKIMARWAKLYKDVVNLRTTARLNPKEFNRIKKELASLAKDTGKYDTYYSLELEEGDRKKLNEIRALCKHYIEIAEAARTT